MITPICDLSTPSKLTILLSSLKGRKITNMIRFNTESIDDLINYFEIDPKDFFSLSNGSILVYFEDGLVIGFSDDPSGNTLVLWVEKNEIGQTTEWLLETWDESIPFYAKDFEQWNVFIGQEVRSVSIIKEIDINNENPRIDSLPSERGILFGFDNELSLIISYGLNSPSYDTTVINLEQIDPYFGDRLIYIDV